MHPYRMQQLIKERGKDKVINVRRRGSLYQTIDQLQRAGLISIQETLREENRPERTIYALTDKGHRTAEEWMRAIISTPTDEFPEFPAAISFLPLLTPDDALLQLEKREAALRDKLAEIEKGLETNLAFLPRLVLLEDEYLRDVTEAELKWVRFIVEDLRAGRLIWSEELLREFLEAQKDNDSAP
jgi:DNA-binding PadR family transcriptional regulator